MKLTTYILRVNNDGHDTRTDSFTRLTNKWNEYDLSSKANDYLYEIRS